MIPEFGQLCLVTAMMASLLQATLPLLQRMGGNYPILGLTRPLACITFLLIVSSFGALISAYIQSDFTVLNVILNSHSSKPLLYKIIGAWGNHEGSMLLWMLVLATCGAAVALIHAHDTQLKAFTLCILGTLNTGFLAFIIFTSNPFLRVFPPPLNGEDLNPILQDIGLALHPPTLYVGYVGFGVVFAYAMAGLFTGRVDREWAKTIHPWIMLPWSALTFGIAAGSWWAYRELGWGGWWFWDPVENVSLLPWLAGTALLHSNMVLEKRGQLGKWVVLLAIITFSLSLIGTFIVRSGLITSVHAFAADPLRGIYILSYIAAVTGSALIVFAWRSLPPSAPVHLLSRSGFILINNLLLLTAAATILLAILYPVFLELAGMQTVSVGPSYFNRSLLPMAALLLPLAALAPLMAWDRTHLTQLRTLAISLSPAVGAAILLVLAIDSPNIVAMLGGIGIASFTLAAAARYTHKQLRAHAFGLRQAASATSHVGVGILVLGITLTSVFKQTYEAPIGNAPLQFGSYTLTLTHTEITEGSNYTARRATFSIRRNGHSITELTPELRDYPVRAMQTAEVALYSTPQHDLYLVLGETTANATKTLGLRMYITPAQQWIWAGFALIGTGGILALLAGILSHRRKVTA